MFSLKNQCRLCLWAGESERGAGAKNHRVAPFPYASKSAERKQQNKFQMLKFFPFEQIELLPIIKIGISIQRRDLCSH